MSTNHITRVQPGVPSGGQFTATGHAEAGVSLNAEAGAWDSTEVVEALDAAERAYRAANVRFHSAVDARDYQGTDEAGKQVFVARDALLLARDAENSYNNASIEHSRHRTSATRRAAADAQDAFLTARRVVRDLTGTPTYRR